MHRCSQELEALNEEYYELDNFRAMQQKAVGAPAPAEPALKAAVEPPPRRPAAGATMAKRSAPKPAVVVAVKPKVAAAAGDKRAQPDGAPAVAAKKPKQEEANAPAPGLLLGDYGSGSDEEA